MPQDTSPESGTLLLYGGVQSSVGYYGLDRGKWVTVRPPDDVPLDLLLAWIEESYRTVAPKTLVALLDAQSGAG